MPNDQKDKPCKDRVNKLAAEAKSKLDKVKKDHPDLTTDLQPVYDSLQSIASDPHK
ncbi:MAG TPA: hypothetical protein VH227_06465 [Candidatus Udaeobacter sp.]|jgi:hypothetical protein|nr:hypothetical protein [Candidatus Udaeobacter sp.]